MTSITPPGERLVSLFSQTPCWMIQPLAAEMRYSIPSVRRFLAEVGYLSSFTHNGGWYTLRSIPSFDRDGLWFYRDIGFSRAGSLTKTLIWLISRSATGMSAEMLGKILRCRCHAVLVNLWRKGKIDRDKMGRCHFYFSADPPTAAVQRRALEMQNLPEVKFSAEIAVLVLAEFIRNPDLGFEQLAEKISRSKKVAVNVKEIEKLFDQHGLKKTPLTARSAPLKP
ncbi:MAG: hypothetical protein R6U13_05085 [Desulfatiglandaceae bacterium]